jgi:CheY-like chemotaxis protein
VARVLLVDDDIAEISAVKRLLARSGHQPVLATNASDALASVARSPPDLLLVGATCEGGEALRRFAAYEAARGIPLVVLGETPEAPPRSAQVSRPIDPEQLGVQVTAMLAAALRRAPAPSAASAPAGPSAASAPARASPASARAGSPPAPARAGSSPGSAPAGSSPPSAPASSTTAPGARRAAAADALRARADELRRGTSSPSPETGAGPAPPAFGTALEGEEEDDGLEAILRRAEEAERAHAAEQRLPIARARQAPAAAPPDPAEGERARRQPEGTAGTSRSPAAQGAPLRAEAVGRAEATPHGAAGDATRRAEEAEARARAEAQARRRAEEELERMRQQVESERLAADERIQHVMARAEAEERASEDLRRLAEEEAARRIEQEGRRREAEEEQLRNAIASARTELETLRRKGEEDARRRARAEAEVLRLAREAERRTEEAAALPPPFELPVYRPPAEEPRADPAEEAARRRVAALRERVAPPEAACVDESVPAPPQVPVRPPPPELRGGNLADLPAPRLLALAARAAMTGRLDFEGEATRSLWLEGGRVVGAASADPAERVEELALRLGLVTRDQHRQVSGAASSLSSRRAALLLLERGFLKPTELTSLARRRVEEVAFGVFAEAGARFRWAPVEVAPDERTALERGTLALAVEGVRRRWLGERVDAVLGGPGTLLAPLATAPPAAELALSAEERRAVGLADGLRTLDEILAASPLDSLSTRQVLAALVLVGSLAVRVFQAGRPAAVATAAIDLARVSDKLDQVRRADYFGILGVARLCTPHEVREAADRLTAEFDPLRYGAVREDGLGERLDEIRRVIGEAREILVDDRLRAEYLRGLGD